MRKRNKELINETFQNFKTCLGSLPETDSNYDAAQIDFNRHHLA